jgi:hypothetical protein
MNRDDIIRMAREAGLSNDFGRFGYPYLPELERFAKLVAAAEREACAKVCEQLYADGFGINCCAAAIRARGEAK